MGARELACLHDIYVGTSAPTTWAQAATPEWRRGLDTMVLVMQSEPELNSIALKLDEF